MIIVRPVERRDWDHVWGLSFQTGSGFSSLQPNEEDVQYLLSKALDSFAQKRNDMYLFVLEDTEINACIGVAGIKNNSATEDALPIFKKENTIKDLNKESQAITLSDGFFDCTELCTLFLLPKYRKIRGAGYLLSKSRFLFMANHRGKFYNSVIAQLRGVFVKKTESVFWHQVMRDIIGLSYTEMEDMIRANTKSAIQRLPRFSLCLDKLDKRVQESVGQTHNNTSPAFKILEREGFEVQNLFHILDVGPIVSKDINNIVSVRSSRVGKVSISDVQDDQTGLFLIGNTEFAGYRCILDAVMSVNDECVVLSKQQADSLNVKEGDFVRFIPFDTSAA